MGTQMGRIGQIAVGALVAAGVFGASVGIDCARLNTHQPEYAARQLERLYVDAKVVEGTVFVIRSLLSLAD